MLESARTDSVAPLITIIITSFNHGHFLADAIDSCLNQNYPKIEVVVVDDGSTDDTRTVAERYAAAKYFYQPNMGLSAARNTGIDQSNGEFIVFLDADDWLLPSCLTTNYLIIKEDPTIAFVSGAFEIFKTTTHEIIPIKNVVTEFHFRRMLEFNYISMISTVLFRRRVFDEFRFDNSKGVCEDYDLYLKILRKYPVLHHTEVVAVYRFHSDNVSYNTIMMLEATISILQNQTAVLKNRLEKNSLKKGVLNWKKHFSKVIYARYSMLDNSNKANKKKEMGVLWRNSKSLYFRLFLKKLFYAVQSVFKA